MLMIIYNLITIIQTAIATLTTNVATLLTNAGTIITNLATANTNINTINTNTANPFNPSLWKEHQVSLTPINSSSLVTIMSVAGKGILEEVLMMINAYGTVGANAPELVITVDGTVVLDITEVPRNDPNLSIYGLYPSKDLIPVYNSANLQIAGAENLLGSMLVLTGTSPLKVPFPSSTQVTGGSLKAGLVGLEEPLYFNTSLLIQAKGSPSTSGTLNVIAKAKY